MDCSTTKTGARKTEDNGGSDWLRLCTVGVFGRLSLPAWDRGHLYIVIADTQYEWGLWNESTHTPLVTLHKAHNTFSRQD
jgi:hypothetical protein